MKYRLTGEVRRNVIDEVTLVVEASSEDEAREKATRVLNEYPKEHSIEGVSYVYVENREQLDATVVRLGVHVTGDEVG